jgi:hypothetical protein
MGLFWYENTYTIWQPWKKPLCSVFQAQQAMVGTRVTRLGEFFIWSVFE